MRKLHQIEERVKHSRRNAGVDVNGFELVIALLCVVTGFGFLATEQLPLELRDAPLVRIVFEGVSLAYVGGGLGVIAGLGLRLVWLEWWGLAVLMGGLAGHAVLVVVMPALVVSMIQLALIVAVLLACFGRLRVLRQIKHRR